MKILKILWCFLKGIIKLILFCLMLIVFVLGYFIGIILAVGGYKSGGRDSIDIISDFLSNLLDKIMNW